MNDAPFGVSTTPRDGSFPSQPGPTTVVFLEAETLLGTVNGSAANGFTTYLRSARLPIVMALSGMPPVFT